VSSGLAGIEQEANHLYMSMLRGKRERPVARPSIG
jgi:hypothetical protein